MRYAASARQTLDGPKRVSRSEDKRERVERWCNMHQLPAESRRCEEQLLDVYYN
jgi:hypothetical protein